MADRGTGNRGADELATFVGWGDPIARSTPYHAWQPVFARYFGTEDLKDAASRRDKVLARFADRPEWLRLAPLVSPIVQADIQENEHTSPLVGTVRAESTRDLLVGLLAETAEERPVLVVLDDAHWLDSESVALALAATRNIPRLLLVLATRPTTTPLPAMQRLRSLPDTEIMEVSGLDADGHEALLADTYGVASVPPHLVAWIRSKTQGNPFFSQEVARSLREQGLVEVEKGAWLEAPTASELERVTVSPTVEGIVASRIDRLTTRQQLVLKTASVVGSSFALSIVRDVFPIAEQRNELESELEALIEADLLTRGPSGTETVHAFKHGITLDVTYNMMLGEQRRRIHRALGEWYEQSRDLGPGSLLPLLAHHWDRTDDDAKAIEYLEKASAVTLDEGAYQEAAQLLRRVLERDAGLAQEQGELVDDLRRARWNRQLADVHLGLGETEECSRRVRTSLELAAHPLPDSRAAWKKSLVLQILIQTSHLLTARSRRAPVPDEHKLEAARAATVLAERAYYESDALAMATASLLAVNLAEKVGEFALVARSYALIGLFAGLSRLHPLARRYFERARTVARETEDYRGLSVARLIEGNYHLCFGEFGPAYELYRTALEEARAFGTWKEREMLEATLATADDYTGRFRDSLERWSRILEVGEEQASAQLRVYGMIGIVHDLLMLGRIDEAFERFEALEQANTKSDLANNNVVVNGIVAIGHLRRGSKAAARTAADETMKWIRQLGTFSFYLMTGHSAPVEVYLELWESARREAPSDVDGLRQSALEALAQMRSWAKSFPVGEPRARLFAGQVHWLSDRPSKARASWLSALERSRALGTPFEEALVCHELGRTGVLPPGDARSHLERAQSLFAELGCEHHQARTEDALRRADVTAA